MTRDEAYRMVQRHSMTAWSASRNLRDLLAEDPAVPLSPTALEACFSLERIHDTAHVAFERLRGLEVAAQPRS
jgi:adenylosuccinate lyase